MCDSELKPGDVIVTLNKGLGIFISSGCNGTYFINNNNIELYLKKGPNYCFKDFTDQTVKKYIPKVLKKYVKSAVECMQVLQDTKAEVNSDGTWYIDGLVSFCSSDWQYCGKEYDRMSGSSLGDRFLEER